MTQVMEQRDYQDRVVSKVNIVPKAVLAPTLVSARLGTRGSMDKE